MEEKSFKNVSPFRRVLPQILAVSAKNTLTLNFGLSIAFPTMVIPALKKSDNSKPEDLVLSEEQLSWLGSLFFIAIPIGCLLSGPAIHKFGRKYVMMILCIPFSLAWWLFSIANSPAALYGSVAMHGLVNGLLEAPILTYVAEISEPHWRGVFSSTSVVAGLGGVSLQLLLGNFMHWRTAAMVNIAFPMISFISLCFVPESPHWLVGRGNIKRAEAGLMWLRGWTTADAVKEELDALRTFNKDVEANTLFNWKLYTDKSFIKPFSIVVITFMVGHFSGMSTLQTYAVGIFDELKTPFNGYEATAAEGFIQLSGAIFCLCILSFVGRRYLAITTTLGTFICLGSLAIFGTGWPAFILLLTAVFLINSCIKVFPWVLIGEVFAPEVRDIASGAASCIGYSLGFLVNKTYYSTRDELTLHGVIGVYALVSLLGAIYFYFLLPETEGRTLEEVQEHFKGIIDLTKVKKGHAIHRDGVINASYVPES